MSENQRVVFVKNLCHYMKLRGVDQSDIVVALGVSASTVSDWVTGKKYPRVDAMQRLADFFGVVISDLTSESTGPRPADPQEEELLEIYRGLNAAGQGVLMGTARGLACNEQYKRGSASSTETA